MFRTKILPATMTAIIALGATGAAFAESDEHGSRKEIAAALSAKISITQAISAAEQKTGGRAVKIDVEKHNGAYLYEIKTMSTDTVTEVFIDPASGQVTKTENEGFIARLFDREDRGEFAKLAAAPTTFAAAIATAEQQVDGKAIKAGFDTEKGVMLYKVRVVKDNVVHRVIVDSATGKVTKVSATEDDEHEG